MRSENKQAGLDASEDVSVSVINQPDEVEPGSTFRVDVEVNHSIPFAIVDPDLCDAGLFQSGFAFEVNFYDGDRILDARSGCYQSGTIQYEFQADAPDREGVIQDLRVELRGGNSGNFLDDQHLDSIDVIGDGNNGDNGNGGDEFDVQIVSVTAQGDFVEVEVYANSADRVDLRLHRGGDVIATDTIQNFPDGESQTSNLQVPSDGTYTLTVQSLVNFQVVAEEERTVNITSPGNGDNGDNGDNGNGGQEPSDGFLGMDRTTLMLAGGLGVAGAGAVAFVATEDQNEE